MSLRNKRNIYVIIHTNHGKQLENIVSKPTESQIYKCFNELLKENKKVIFPMRYNNHEHVMIESEHELVIIKCKDHLDKSINKVKDDSGKYVNYETNDENWIVVDRAAYEVEETFWVYGYHPRLQRKTFQWIFDEFVAKNSDDKTMFKTICIYQNKVLFECGNTLNMVLCKTKSDAIRFYNLIESWCQEKKRKYKYIFFLGDLKDSKYKSEWISKIQKLTNWDIIKIRRPSTRP